MDYTQTTKDVLEVLAITAGIGTTVFGYKTLVYDARKKKKEADKIDSDKKQVDAATVETIIDSAQKVIQIYRDITVKLENTVVESATKIKSLEERLNEFELKVEKKDEYIKEMLEGIEILSKQLIENQLVPKWLPKRKEND